jgi:5-methylcytosine-specific restriction protein A
VTEPKLHDLDWELDELILAGDLVIRNGWRQLPASDPEVVELSELLQKLAIHPRNERMPNFRSASSVARKTADIATNQPGYMGIATRGGGATRRFIPALLANPAHIQQLALAIREGARHGDFAELSRTAEDDDVGAMEGRLLLRRHVAHERSRSLRRRKLKAVLEAGGSLSCEVCGFNFEQAYGERGKGFIECHHVLPLHTRPPKITRLKDLVLLCANCHRMSHVGSPWLSPAELKRLVLASAG